MKQETETGLSLGEFLAVASILGAKGADRPPPIKKHRSESIFSPPQSFRLCIRYKLVHNSQIIQDAVKFCHFSRRIPGQNDWMHSSGCLPHVTLC